MVWYIGQIGNNTQLEYIAQVKQYDTYMQRLVIGKLAIKWKIGGTYLTN